MKVKTRKMVALGDMAAVIDASAEQVRVEYGYLVKGVFKESAWKPNSVFLSVESAERSAKNWVNGVHRRLAA